MYCLAPYCPLSTNWNILWCRGLARMPHFTDWILSLAERISLLGAKLYSDWVWANFQIWQSANFSANNIILQRLILVFIYYRWFKSICGGHMTVCTAFSWVTNSWNKHSVKWCSVDQHQQILVNENIYLRETLRDGEIMVDAILSEKVFLKIYQQYVFYH